MQIRRDIGTRFVIEQIQPSPLLRSTSDLFSTAMTTLRVIGGIVHVVQCSSVVMYAEE